jgi:outer membrane autotransporter protein
MEKNNKLKKILTTASVFAMIAGASNSAAGAQVTTANAGNVVIDSNAQGANTNAALNANDSFHLSHDLAGNTITIGTAGNPVAIATFDLNGRAVRDVIVAESSSIASFINSTGAQNATLTVNDGITLTLSGLNGVNAANVAANKGNFAALGDITLGSAGGGDATLKVNLNNVTLSGAIDGDQDSQGKIEAGANAGTVFAGAIGQTHSLEEIKITGVNEVKFNEDVKADKLLFGAAATTTFDKKFEGQIDFAGNAASVVKLGNGSELTSVVTTAGAPQDGTLQFNGAAIATGDIGSANKLLLVKANGAGIVNLKGEVKATTLEVANAGADVRIGGEFTGNTKFSAAGGSVKFSNTVTGDVDFTTHKGTVEIVGDKTLTGDITNTGAVDATGTLKFTGAGGGGVDGNIGNAAKALELIEVATADANAVNLGNGNAVKAATLRINSENANAADQTVAQVEGNFTGNVEFSSDTQDGGTLQLDNGGNGATLVEGRITNTSGADARGNILVDADDATITGDIGAEGSALKDVKVNSAHTLELSGALNKATNKHYAETFTFSDNAAQITVVDKSELHAERFVSTGVEQGNIVFAKGGAIEGTIGAKNNVIKLVEAGNANAGVVTVGAGDHHVAKFNATDKAGSGFVFENGANVTGAIDSRHVNNTLEFQGKSTVTGKIGETTKFASITLKDNAELTLKPKVVQTVNGAVQVESAGQGKLVIDKNTANKSVTFKEAIGGDGKELGSLVLESNFEDTATLEKGSFIQEVDLKGDATLALGKNGGDETFKLNSITTATANKGTLSVVAGAANGVTFEALTTDGADIGTAENPLKDITFGNNDTKLTLGKNVKLYAKDASAAGKGVLTLGNGSALYIADNETKGLNSIKVGSAANDVAMIGDEKLGGKVKVANGVELGHNEATLELATATITVGVDGIRSKNTGTGTLMFVGEEKSTVEALVGAGNKTFGSIKFEGSGDVDFNKAVVVENAASFEFNNLKEDITVKFNGINDKFGTNTFKNNSVKIPTFDLNDKAMEFTGKIEGNGQINFKTVNTENIAIQSKYFGNANITGGKLRMDDDNAIIRSAGTDAVRLPEITFVRDGTITNGAHSKANIVVDAGKKAKLGGAITTDEGNSIALGVGSAVLLTNADVGTRITGDVAGRAEFEGDVVLRKEVNTGNVVFNKDSKTTLHANIEAATEISGEQARVDLANNVKFTKGKVSFKDSAISLDEYQLQLNVSAGNNVTFEGTNTINATMKNVDDNNLVSGGNITMSTGKLKYDNAKFKVSVKDESARPVGETRTYKLLTVANGVPLDGNLTEKDIEVNPTDRDNRLVMNQWNADVSKDGSIELKQTDNAENVLVGLAQEVAALDGSAAKNMKILASAKPGTAGYNLVDLLARVGHKRNSEKVNDSKKIITDLENNTAHTQVLTGQVTQFSNNVMTRVGQIQEIAAAAAGDGNYKYGSWVNPFYSVSEQKARGDLTGYKEESFGASIGFDSEMSSDMVLGAAFNMSKNKVTYEGIKKGDETAVNSFALSLYGMKQISDYWSLSSVATMASSNIKNETKKVSGVGTPRDLVTGENKALSFNGEFTATYSQDIGGAVMSPMGGLRYTRVNATGYKETGSSTQNLDIAAHANDKLEVVAGMKLSVPGLDINGLPVTPDVHASVDYDVLANPNKQTVRLDGMNLASADYKPARAVYNLGVGAHAEYDIWEYGIGYDMQISDKRLGHQGNFKLRVNF